jgi:anti-anti-sigma factor
MGQKTHPPLFATRTSGNTVVDLPGDIDIGNAWVLRDGLVALLDDGIPSLIMNMTATRFCDCAGIRVIVQVGQHAETLRVPVCVALPADGPVRRVAELTGLSHELQVATGTAAAQRRMSTTPAPAEL